MGYILLSHWPEGFHGTPKTTQTIAKPIGCSLQPDGKALLLKTALTYYYTWKSQTGD